MTQELDRNQCIHWRLQKYFQGGNVAILLIFSGVMIRHI